MSIYKQGRPTVYKPFAGGGRRPPKAPGEYRALANDGSVAYVGETNNLNRSFGEHQRSGKLNQTERPTVAYKVADGRSTSATRREHERQKIAQHNPSLNLSKGGEGRSAGR